MARRASRAPSAEANAPGRTLLGGAQKAWLKGELERSRATWKVVANQVMIMALDVPARTTVNPDQWDGYGAERRELLEFVQARGIKDVTFVTGDIHTFFAGNVTPSGREGVPAVDGTPAATEFVAGAITSKGLEETLPAEGPVAGPTTEAGVRANNPHILQADLARRGYAVLEARPTSCGWTSGRCAPPWLPPARSTPSPASGSRGARPGSTRSARPRRPRARQPRRWRWRPGRPSRPGSSRW